MNRLYASHSAFRSRSQLLRFASAVSTFAILLVGTVSECRAVPPQITVGYGRGAVLVSGDPGGGHGFTEDRDGGSGATAQVPVAPSVQPASPATPSWKGGTPVASTCRPSGSGFSQIVSSGTAWLPALRLIFAFHVGLRR